MRDFTKSVGNWLWQRKDEIVLKVIVIPVVMLLFSWIVSLFIQSEVIRAIAFVAALAILVAGGCYLLVWLDRRKSPSIAPVPINRRLLLLRIASEGERLATALERKDDVYRDAINLTQWWGESRQTVKDLCPESWDHFADLGELRPDAMEQQARLFVQRIREVLDELGK